MHTEEDFRELARVAWIEAEATPDRAKAKRLRELARNYERQAEELRRDRAVEADACAAGNPEQRA